MNSHAKQILILSLLVISLCSPSFSFATSLNPSQDDIILAEGTPINVITAQEITSKEAKPNDPVNFTVNEDVLVNGQVIVKKGTPALGSVINAEKRGYMGKSGHTTSV